MHFSSHENCVRPDKFGATRKFPILSQGLPPWLISSISAFQALLRLCMNCGVFSDELKSAKQRCGAGCVTRIVTFCPHVNKSLEAILNYFQFLQHTTLLLTCWRRSAPVPAQAVRSRRSWRRPAYSAAIACPHRERQSQLPVVITLS